jgi:hypothetical protein
LNIQVAFVYGDEMSGKCIQLTTPDSDMSVKHIREYLLKCAQGTDGIPHDQEQVKRLLDDCGLDVESIKNDPIQIRQNIMGVFMETELPNCPIVERTHVIFIHPKPVVK